MRSETFVLPEIPAYVDEAAYRWPLWLAAGLAVAFTVAFIVLFLVSLRRTGILERSARRGILQVALGLAILMSVLSAAALDGWTEDRYYAATSERWETRTQNVEAAIDQVEAELGLTIDAADLALFAEGSAATRAVVAVDTSGAHHDCSLERVGNDAFSLDCDSEG